MSGAPAQQPMHEASPLPKVQTKPVRIALVNFGTLGDVNPFLALAQSLQRIGHAPVMLSNPAFAGAARAAGVPFQPIGTVGQYDAMVQHPFMWHPVKGFGVYWRYLLKHAVQPTVDALEAMQPQGVIAGPFAFGAALAEERGMMPLSTAYTAPSMLRSVHDPMVFGTWQAPRWLPLGARRWLWQQLDTRKLQPMLVPDLNVVRASLGLPPMDGRTSVLGEWAHARHGFALFPEGFAAQQPDWPKHLDFIGFPMVAHDDGNVALQADTAQALSWLGNGKRAALVNLGSGAVDAAAKAMDVVVALNKQGMRALVILPQSPGGTASPGNDLAMRKDVFAGHDEALTLPHVHLPSVLPHCALVVHHGGIGMAAQSLLAGVPQLILARAYDQFENGVRIAAFGRGVAIPFLKADIGRLRRAIKHLCPDLDTRTHRPAPHDWAMRDAVLAEAVHRQFVQ
jgi:rhamnosyltransferase subunit B